MPWKGEKNAYKIWLSEIILQQTRVEQGWAYYLRFVNKYPDVQQLAAAPEAEVMKLWEGLGYYSRCRNLIASAKMIVSEYGGLFPTNYEGILSLKGVGNYTAAAIASFAFGLPHAVVDGNVQRVLARFFGIEIPIDTTEGKKKFESLAGELLDKNEPARYNQAIMDFGATVCKPQLPLCETCPLNNSCIAYSKDKVDLLPLKIKKLVVKQRWFNYFIIRYLDKVYVRVKKEKDIWQDLNEFVLQETESSEDLENWQAYVTHLMGDVQFELIKEKRLKPHKLSHQSIHSNIYFITIQQPMPVNRGYDLISIDELEKLAFPKLLKEFCATNVFK
jgi:A/G-specific adenine glycosylase